MTDEPYPEGFEEQYEVVPVDEPSLEDYPGPGPGPTANDQQYDEFGAPIAKPVRVHDGVRDTKRR